jgi:Tol biopolymer transport system component
MLRYALLICGAQATVALGAAAQAAKAPAIQNGAPLVSPTAPRILFESNRTGTNQLWIIDETGERQLTREPAGVGGGQWAANGSSLFYSVASHDSSVLYELWPDSARQRKIGTFPGRSPEVAPGRAQVIYDVGPWTASHLVMTDINQRSARQLTDDSHTVWLGVWSPDATRIAYTASDKSGIAVWVMNVDGSNPHRVTHLTAAEGRAQMPAWSPDSQQLAFQASSSTAKGKSTIWIIDLRTGGEREILPHSSIFLDETPSWFSDGVSLAFQSNRSGRMQIWTVNANGTGLRQITR